MPAATRGRLFGLGRPELAAVGLYHQYTPFPSLDADEGLGRLLPPN